jgi:hypothetical protein
MKKKLKLEWKEAPSYKSVSAWFKGCGIETAFLILVISAIATVPQLPENLPLTAFFRNCPFYSITGLSCPSCGMTRASGALFQGHFIDAFRNNPFIYLINGFLFYRLFQRLSETFLKKYPVFANIPVLFYILLFSSYILFGVFRIIFEIKGNTAL